MTALIGSRTSLRALVLLACAGACTGESQPPKPAEVVSESSAQPERKTPAESVGSPVAGQRQWSAGIVDVQPEVDSIAVLRAVRVGRHDDFERITFEFEGSRMPGYHIEYVDRPVHACGSGDVVPLPGDAWLSVRFNPAVAHTEEGRPTIGQRVIVVNQPIIRELRITCDFEADVMWVTGQTKPAQYTTQVLRDPLRLVLDIRNE